MLLVARLLQNSAKARDVTIDCSTTSSRDRSLAAALGVPVADVCNSVVVSLDDGDEDDIVSAYVTLSYDGARPRHELDKVVLQVAGENEQAKVGTNT